MTSILASFVALPGNPQLCQIGANLGALTTHIVASIGNNTISQAPLPSCRPLVAAPKAFPIPCTGRDTLTASCCTAADLSAAVCGLQLGSASVCMMVLPGIDFGSSSRQQLPVGAAAQTSSLRQATPVRHRLGCAGWHGRGQGMHHVPLLLHRDRVVFVRTNQHNHCHA